MRRWQELAIEIAPDAADALSAWLVERGAPGIIEEAAGDRLRLRAHFEQGAELRGALADFLADLDEVFPGAASATVAATVVDEEDWADGWKQSFPPLEIGHRLRVRPPWVEAVAVGRRDIVIMPAMAFGTGHHASTLGCLLAIESIFERDDPPSRVLDVGTGSGILAIAAAHLGASLVLGVDTDPVAIDAAADNVRRNGVAGAVALQVGSIDTVADRFGLIAANLHSGILRPLFAPLRECALPRAWLIVSGILDADVTSLSETAAATRWSREAERSIDGWTTIVFRRE